MHIMLVTQEHYQRYTAATHAAGQVQATYTAATMSNMQTHQRSSLPSEQATPE